MKKYNLYLKQAILEAVNNQLENNDPPETRETMERLIAEGFSRKQAMEMIGVAVSAQVYDILKEKREFDRVKFVNDLNRLPELP